MGKLYPGKGAFLHLNGDTLRFVATALDELCDVIAMAGIELLEASDEAEDDFDGLNMLLDEVGANKVFEFLRRRLTPEEGATNEWHFTSDDFGDKLYAATPWKNGEYRITIVCTPSGELKLDVREWYEPKANK